MAAADVFVVLAHVQFEKNNYQNRFHIGENWYTLSVIHGRSLETIMEKRYARPVEDWDKIKARLPEHARALDRFDDLICESLYRTNFRIILEIATRLKIKTEIVLDPALDSKGTDRLVEICRIFGADTYLSGPSGRKYLELDKFAQAGIAVEFHDSKRPEPIVKVLHEL